MPGYLLPLLICLLGGQLWWVADSAKITCKVCKKFVESFDKRLEATADSSYAGGDTSWEEENLGSYSDSEVRLVEILDTVCGRSDYECNSLLEEAEEDIEKWWLSQKKEKERGPLQPWLCFSFLAVCCPPDTFGPSCQHCPGAPNNTCGGRGKCEGAEEKEGKGTCACDEGYGGDMCDSCAAKYYQEEEEEEEEGGEEEEEGSRKLECKACDKSCATSCDGPGAADCDACADGYRENDGGSCEDIDECKIDGDTRCKEGDYCFNTPGSFHCNDCDKACKKICNGPGPAKCAECANGYTRNEHGVCKDDDECEAGSAECSVGTYCENTPGKYTCKACHVSCLSGCHGAGVKGCVACKEGYVMSVEDGCEDMNECDSNPCQEDTEVCSNMPGSFTCKCKSGLVRGEEGACITAEERAAQRELKRAKKNSKKKKKKKKVEKQANQAEVQAEGERQGLKEPESGESHGEAENGSSSGNLERGMDQASAERTPGDTSTSVGGSDGSLEESGDARDGGQLPISTPNSAEGMVGEASQQTEAQVPGEGGSDIGGSQQSSEPDIGDDIIKGAEASQDKTGQQGEGVGSSADQSDSRDEL